ncbi:MAG TPA: hypothetical protein VFJ19_14315 [Nocardioidaceae bacterium]|nr:hypothetical protein [Nocardioidaceae bacterium]
MRLERKHSLLLLGVAAWNLASYTTFAKNLAKAHARGEDRPTGYWIAHSGLIAVNLSIAGVLARLGIRSLRAS